MRHKIGTAAAAALLTMAMAAPACAQGPEITVQRPAAKGDTLQVTLSHNTIQCIVLCVKRVFYRFFFTGQKVYPSTADSRKNKENTGRAPFRCQLQRDVSCFYLS